MEKFKPPVRVKFQGKTEAESLNVVAATCTICGNVMLNASNRVTFTKRKTRKLTK